MHAGKRCMARDKVEYARSDSQDKKKLTEICQGGVTGDWKFSVSENGYVNRDVMLDIIRDLDEHCTKHAVQRPVVLFLDGFRGHFSMQISALCREKQIQPWVFRPFMTHILQPLDLVAFGPLKKRLENLCHLWHTKHPGEQLSKGGFI